MNWARLVKSIVATLLSPAERFVKSTFNRAGERSPSHSGLRACTYTQKIRRTKPRIGFSWKLTFPRRRLAHEEFRPRNVLRPYPSDVDVPIRMWRYRGGY